MFSQNLTGITKQQVTNLSLPGDAEDYSSQPLLNCACIQTRLGRKRQTLHHPAGSRPLCFLSQARAETCWTQLRAINSRGNNLPSQSVPESLYQLEATVFIITYMIAEAGLVTVLSCGASQERKRDETNDQGAKPQLDRLLD